MAVLSALDKSEQIFMETFHDAHGQSSRLSMRRRGRVMAMLTLNGLVQNVYTQPASRPGNRRSAPESLRAQILCENIMESGEEARNGHAEGAHRGFQKLVGQKVRIPVGAFVAKGAIMFYALRNEAQPISAS
jgi:hypothetical protein